MMQIRNQKRISPAFFTVVTVSLVLFALLALSEGRNVTAAPAQNAQKTIELPAPKLDGSSES